jgi:hypothetical protein
MSKIKTKSISWFTILLVIGAIIALIIVVYKGLFPQRYFELRELEQNQAKWASQHITHYRMSVHGYEYATSLAVTVEVKDGTVVSVVDTQSKKVLLPTDETDSGYADQYLFTVPNSFSYISKTYLENPAEMRVTYDPALGYPTTIYINRYTEPCCQGFTYEIKDFQSLP